MDVTLAWMTGVVAMMLIFGVFALVGYLKHRSTANDNQTTKTISQ